VVLQHRVDDTCDVATCAQASAAPNQHSVRTSIQASDIATTPRAAAESTPHRHPTSPASQT
jgi:hypothetical protein